MTPSTPPDSSGRDPPESYELRVVPDARYVATARAFAASLARHFRAEEDQVQDVKVAISEAWSNAIKAHRSSGVDEPIQLAVRRRPDGLWFEVADSGSGLGPEHEARIPGADSAELPEAGVGLLIIRSLFPAAEVVRNASGGVTLRFCLPLDSSV